MNKLKYKSYGYSVVEEAKKYIGVPYKWNTNGPNCFDCSGFTQFIFNHVLGIHISRNVYDQLKFGVPVSIDNLIAGDLIFTFNAEHVGIYIDRGLFIHAPYQGQKVKISSISNFYAARRLA